MRSWKKRLRRAMLIMIASYPGNIRIAVQRQIQAIASQIREMRRRISEFSLTPEASMICLVVRPYPLGIIKCIADLYGSPNIHGSAIVFATNQAVELDGFLSTDDVMSTGDVSYRQKSASCR